MRETPRMDSGVLFLKDAFGKEGMFRPDQVISIMEPPLKKGNEKAWICIQGDGEADTFKSADNVLEIFALCSAHALWRDRNIFFDNIPARFLLE